MEVQGSSVRAPRRWRWLTVALCASVVIILADLAYRTVTDGAFEVTPALGLCMFGYLVIGLIFAARAAAHPALDRRTRQAWVVVATAYLLFVVSSTLRASMPIGAVFPSAADVLRLLFVPVMLVGVLMLPLRVQGRWQRHRLWLDCGIVMIAGAMLLWFTQPATSGTAQISGARMAAAIAYPVSDLVMIFGAVFVSLRGAANSARSAATFLGAAMLFLVLGDALLARHLGASGSPVHNATWQWACWLTAHFFFAMAPVAQCLHATRHRLETGEAKAHTASRLPYLAIGLGFLLLLISVAHQEIRIIGMAAGAVCITALVVLRQIISARENYELAVTDTLTGLSNRRHFYHALRDGLARSARNGRTIAVLVLDLNGFKQVNDTMGHNAGDQMLIAFGDALQRNVLGLDVVGRLGGDEFAVVLFNVREMANAEAVVHRLTEDLAQPVLIGDTPVQLRASIGVALSRPGELSAEEVLRHADEAMYRAKESTRRTGATSVAVHPPADQPGAFQGATRSRP